MELGQRPTQPAVGLVLVAKRVLGERLNAEEPNGAVGFIGGQGLMLLGAVAARALRDHEAFDFLLCQACLGETLERGQREAVADGQCQVAWEWMAIPRIASPPSLRATSSASGRGIEVISRCGNVQWI